MGIPPIRPENEQPIKQWFDVGNHGPALREDLQQAAVHLRAGQRVRQEAGGSSPSLSLALPSAAYQGDTAAARITPSHHSGSTSE